MKPVYRLVWGLVVAVAVSACTDESEPQSAQDTPAPAATQEEQALDPLTALRQQAVPEDDLPARVAGRIAVVAEEIYRDAANGSPLWKNPTVVVEDCVLTITNEADGQPERIVVPLAKLDVRNGFRLIPDRGDNPYPGMAVATIDGEPVVEVTWNGRTQRDNEFSIKLLTREQFERLVPALVHAVRLCDGSLK